MLLGHAWTYRGMEEQSDPVTKHITRVLRIWDLSTFHPLILWINAQELENSDKEELFKIVEAYIVRRELCGLTTKNYNKVVIMMIRSLNEHNADPGIFVNNLTKLAGDASRMPSDSEVLEAAVKRTIYSSMPTSRLRYLMQQIEYAKRNKFDETMFDTSDITIEHVMPRKWAEHWPLPSGAVAPCESIFQAGVNGHFLEGAVKAEMETRQQSVDVLGNLTLVTKSLNPSLSNAAWPIKRDRLGKSLLVLNREIAEKHTWDEGSITERGKNLGSLVNDIWTITS